MTNGIQKQAQGLYRYIIVYWVMYLRYKFFFHTKYANFNFITLLNGEK